MTSTETFLTPVERAGILVRVLLLTLAAPILFVRGPVRGFTLLGPVRVRRSRRLPAAILVALADRVLLARLFGRLVFRTRCLKRAFVLHRLLRGHGHDAVAVIGFSRDGEGLCGHAWITLDGRRLEDPVFAPPRDFIPFVEIGSEVRRLGHADL